jgi:hypothetical protein
MEKMQANRRTDSQLDAILCETGHWIVNVQGQALCFAASLRMAIDRAWDFAASGAVVTTLARLPFDNIVVPLEQIDRLRKVIAGRETPVLHLAEQAGAPRQSRTAAEAPQRRSAARSRGFHAGDGACGSKANTRANPGLSDADRGSRPGTPEGLGGRCRPPFPDHQ